MKITEVNIMKLSEVLAALKPFDRWDLKVRRLVIDVNDSARVTLSRRSKYAALAISKVEEIK